MAVTLHYCPFDSSLGKCVIAWREQSQGIAHLQLPDASVKSSVDRIAHIAQQDVEPSQSPPGFVLDAIEKVVSFLAGEDNRLNTIKIDLDGVPQFHRKVYEALREVSDGELVSYKQLAQLAGSPLASRAVGQAMAKNRLPVIVPCHRVIKASGELGNFSAVGGTPLKRRLLEIETKVRGKEKCHA